MGRRLRIVLVCQTYFPAVDGTAVLIQNLAESFSRRGDEVHVVTSRATGPEGFRTFHRSDVNAPDVEILAGVVVHRLASRRRLSALLRPVQSLARRARVPGAMWLGDLYIGPVLVGLRSVLDRIHPDAVYASAFPYLHMQRVVQWGRSRGTAVVLHGAIHPDHHWAFDRPGIRRACRRAAGFAANTEFERRHVEEFGVEPGRVAVVGVGVDPNLTRLAGRAPGESLDEIRPPRILYFGHLSRRKGLGTVIAALPSIWAEHPDTEVTIAGKTTEDADALKREANAIQDGHSLTWHANVTETRKAQLLAATDVVLYPSPAESFGIVFLEAWVFAVPVIGARAGAVPDVIDEGVTGMLVTPGSGPELAGAVNQLINDPELRRSMGSAGRERVMSDNTWVAVAERAHLLVERAQSHVGQLTPPDATTTRSTSTVVSVFEACRRSLPTVWRSRNNKAATAARPTKPDIPIAARSDDNRSETR